MSEKEMLALIRQQHEDLSILMKESNIKSGRYPDEVMDIYRRWQLNQRRIGQLMIQRELF